MSHNDTHSFCVTREREVCKYLVLFFCVIYRFKHDFAFISLNELMTKIIDEFDQSDLVWRTGLELSDLVFIVDWSHIVAYHQGCHEVTDAVLGVSSFLSLLLDVVVLLVSFELYHVLKRSVCFEKHRLDFGKGFSGKLREFHADLFHYHVVLGQSACFVCEKDLDSAKFFRD